MRLTPIAALCTLAALSQAQENDTFEAGDNDGGWSFNVTVPDILETSGGNPDGYLHNPGVDSFAPIATTDTGNGSAFHGDYRAMGVAEIRVDAITHAASFGAAGREFSLLLRDTKGTPDPVDDDYAYYVGDLVPQVGEGWRSFTFPVPSQSTDAVPAGWSGGHAGDLENFRPGVEWSDVITNVDRVELWWLNPSFFAIFQSWDVGIDNAQVLTPVRFRPCPPPSSADSSSACSGSESRSSAGAGARSAPAPHRHNTRRREERSPSAERIHFLEPVPLPGPLEARP